MAKAHRLFFDTNPLNEKWPEVSIRVGNILHFARKLGFPVEIPEPAIIELETHWSARTHERLNCASSAIKDLWKFIDGLASITTLSIDNTKKC
jgi:hypothetical protein